MAETTMMPTSNAVSGWSENFKRSLLVAVVAFAVLQLKELKDAGRFDTVGTAIDGGLIGAGTFLVYAALGVMKGSRGGSKS